MRLQLLLTVISLLFCFTLINGAVVFNHPGTRALVEVYGDVAVSNRTLSAAVSTYSGVCALSSDVRPVSQYALLATGHHEASASKCGSPGLVALASGLSAGYPELRTLSLLADSVVFVDSFTADDITSEITEVNAKMKHILSQVAQQCDEAGTPCDDPITAATSSPADDATIATALSDFMALIPTPAAAATMYTTVGLVGVTRRVSAVSIAHVSTAIMHAFHCHAAPTASCTADDAWLEARISDAAGMIINLPTTMADATLTACETDALAKTVTFVQDALVADNSFIPVLTDPSIGRCDIDAYLAESRLYSADLTAMTISSSTTLYGSSSSTELSGISPAPVPAQIYSPYVFSAPAKRRISYTAACEIGEHRLTSADPCTACGVGSYCPGDDVAYPCDNILKTASTEYYLTGLWYEKCDVKCIDTTQYMTSMANGDIQCTTRPIGTTLTNGAINVTAPPSDEDWASVVASAGGYKARYHNAVRLPQSAMSHLTSGTLSLSAVMAGAPSPSTDALIEIYGLLTVYRVCHAAGQCQFIAWAPSVTAAPLTSTTIDVPSSSRVTVTVTIDPEEVTVVVDLDGAVLLAGLIPPPIIPLADLHSLGPLVGVGATGPTPVPTPICDGYIDTAQPSWPSATYATDIITTLTVATRPWTPLDGPTPTYPVTGAPAAVLDLVKAPYVGLPVTCPDGPVGGSGCLCNPDAFNAVKATVVDITVVSSVDQTVAALGILTPVAVNQVPSTCSWIEGGASCLGLMSGVLDGQMGYLSAETAVVLPAGTNTIRLTYSTEINIANATILIDAVDDIPTVTIGIDGASTSMNLGSWTPTVGFRALRPFIFHNSSTISTPTSCVTCPHGTARSAVPQASALDCVCHPGFVRTGLGCTKMGDAYAPPALRVASGAVSSDDTIDVVCTHCVGTDASVDILVGSSVQTLDFITSDTVQVPLVGLNGTVNVRANVKADGRLTSSTVGLTVDVQAKLPSPTIFPASETRSESAPVQIDCVKGTTVHYEVVRKPVTTITSADKGTEIEAADTATVDVMYGMVKAWCADTTHATSDAVYGFYHLDQDALPAADEPAVVWAIMIVGLLGLSIAVLLCTLLGVSLCVGLRVISLVDKSRLLGIVADQLFGGILRMRGYKHSDVIEQNIAAATTMNSASTRVITVHDVFKVGDKLFGGARGTTTSSLAALLDCHVSQHRDIVGTDSVTDKALRDVNGAVNWGAVFLKPTDTQPVPTCGTCSTEDEEQMAHYAHVTIRRPTLDDPTWITATYYCKECISQHPNVSREFDMLSDVNEASTIIHTAVCAHCPLAHPLLHVVATVGHDGQARREALCPEHAVIADGWQAAPALTQCDVCSVHAANFVTEMYATEAARSTSEIMLCLPCYLRYHSHVLRYGSEANTASMWNVVDSAEDMQ